MNAAIVDRGRGPEIAGTRITVYRIMDFIRAGDSPEIMADHLQLTPDEVRAALTYVAAHAEELEPEYQRILERVRQRNPPWVEAVLAKSPEELRERIMSRGNHVASAQTHGR